MQFGNTKAPLQQCSIIIKTGNDINSLVPSPSYTLCIVILTAINSELMVGGAKEPCDGGLNDANCNQRFTLCSCVLWITRFYSGWADNRSAK